MKEEEIWNPKDLIANLRPQIKRVGKVSLIIFSGIWLAIEPLTFFAQDKAMIFSNLGWSGYAGLIFLSGFCALMDELYRIHSSSKSLQMKIHDLLFPNHNIEIIKTARAVIDQNISIVEEAEDFLGMTGSRSRDISYMRRIEDKIKKKPTIAHFRILWGHPHHKSFLEHLYRLIDCCDPKDRTHGEQKLHLGFFDDYLKEPERFICMNEKKVLIVLPSINGVGKYDTALLISGESEVNSYRKYINSLYHVSQPILSSSDLDTLKVLRKKKKK